MKIKNEVILKIDKEAEQKRIVSSLKKKIPELKKLYKDEFRASMGSIKSFIQSVFFAVFSVLLGFIADYFSIITSFVVFQLINIIPIIVNGKIIENIEKQ